MITQKVIAGNAAEAHLVKVPSAVEVDVAAGAPLDDRPTAAFRLHIAVDVEVAALAAHGVNTVGARLRRLRTQSLIVVVQDLRAVTRCY